MKILFVYPRFEKLLQARPELAQELYRFGVGVFRTPPALGIPLLAALTPHEHELRVLDANMEPVDFTEPADLVAISFFTPQASSAYELADGYRAAGKQVVLGGMHPSALPDEAAAHGDAVVVGEGEPIWPQLLRDAAAGRLLPRYQAAERMSLKGLPLPRREVFPHPEDYEWQAGLVQVSRGCPLRCVACVLPAHMGRRLRYRPVPEVVAELRSMPYDSFYLTDDTVMLPGRANVAYARELFGALKGSGKTCFTSSTLSLNTDPVFLRTLREGGVKTLYTVCGFDPVSSRALARDASQGSRQAAIDAIARVQDAGITVFGSFGLGDDEHDEGIFERVLALSADAGVQLAEFFLATPYPGTPLWDRVRREDRLLHTDWRRFNGAHVVHRPLGMSVEALDRGFAEIWPRFYEGKEPGAALRSLDLQCAPEEWRAQGKAQIPAEA